MMISRPALPILILTVIAATAIAPHAAHPQAIYIDEDFSDWEGIEPAFERVEADAGYFRRIWIANDDDYLFFSLEVSTETILQQSAVTLHIDVDVDEETGAQVGDIGADLTWHFGLRSGTFIANGSQTGIGHHDIGVVNAPTVSGFRFEMALNRHAMPDGEHALFPSEEIRLIFIDAISGDSTPGGESAVSYTFQHIERERPPVDLSRDPRAHVRVAAYNVERDQLFSAGHQDAFRRILQAVAPDFIGFTEIYNNSAAATAEIMQAFLPQPGGWHVGKQGRDLVLASRFPIIESHGIVHDPARFDSIRTGAFLVDLRPDLESDLLVLVSHPSCCTNTTFRQQQLDAMMAFVRDNRPSLEPGTPIMLIGDMNLVTYAYQRRTLLNGDIVNSAFGAPFQPDWDGSPLADLKPPVTGLPMTFTWYDEPNSFSPGRLDYIVYSDYSMEALGAYTLFSPGLTQDELDRYGLLADDTVIASDHLPLVGDFRLRKLVYSRTEQPEVPYASRIRIEAVYPNPAQSAATVSITVPQPSTVTLTVVNLLGQAVIKSDYRSVVGGETIRTTVDLSGLAPGVYFVRASSGGDSDMKKMMLVR